MFNILNFDKQRADTIGIIASSLCLVHCVATPFLFIAKACAATCCSNTPSWWRSIDYFFLVVSYVAIYYATKNSTKNWVKIALWVTWIVLLFTIFNESVTIITLPEMFIYYPALGIVLLHLYNRKYCTCKEDKCSVSNPLN